MALSPEEVSLYHQRVSAASSRATAQPGSQSDTPWAAPSASPSVRSISPRYSAGASYAHEQTGGSALSSFPTLHQLHQNVRQRIAEQQRSASTATSQHLGYDAPYHHPASATPPPQHLLTSVTHPQHSTLEMVQEIMLSSKRSPLPTGREMPMLPPELYVVGNRSSSPPLQHQQPAAPSYSCAGCAALEGKVANLQITVDALLRHQHQLVHALAGQLKRDDDVSPAAGGGGEEKRGTAPVTVASQTEQDMPVASISSLVDTISTELDFVVSSLSSQKIFRKKKKRCVSSSRRWWRGESLWPRSPALLTRNRLSLDFVVSSLSSQKIFRAPTDDAIRNQKSEPTAPKDSALMQLLIQVGERIGQVEVDLETTVNETQKLEDRLVQRLRRVEENSVKSTDLNTHIADWFRMERNEALVLTQNLYRALGVDEEDVRRSVRPLAPQEVEAGQYRAQEMETLWRDSIVGRSLQYFHSAASKRRNQNEARGIHGYDEQSLQLTAAPAAPQQPQQLSMDDVGLLPLPARMLGLQLVDEPFAKGPRVRNVIKGSGAAVSSISVGNYIVAINRVPVRTTADAIAALAVVMPGSHVRIDSVTSRGTSDAAQIVAGSQRVYA
ncbi:Hypothetical protein, putative [Bodo saltans]|uniref:PDZ domain-containing protein n=1 Tax=Bodo saltans TaxID=75058 RepID=A0A0S4J1A0_BODSA|nr:Hypothetical protein, putative [Bodo saltans]|eukprot:CUG52290.1 Hypothetical protein, putative [Bodo saltans]